MKEMLNYNADIAHCPGARHRVCMSCIRLDLYHHWRGLTPDMAESVIMLYPKATRSGCRNMLADDSVCRKRKTRKESTRI